MLHFLFRCSYLFTFLLSSQFYWHISLKSTAYFFDPPCTEQLLAEITWCFNKWLTDEDLLNTNCCYCWCVCVNVSLFQLSCFPAAIRRSAEFLVIGTMIVLFWQDLKTYALTSKNSTLLCSVPTWCWWYIGPVVVGNVGDNSVSSCRQDASETQQLADASPICYLCGVAKGQSSTSDGPTCNTS